MQRTEQSYRLLPLYQCWHGTRRGTRHLLGYIHWTTRRMYFGKSSIEVAVPTRKGCETTFVKFRVTIYDGNKICPDVSSAYKLAPFICTSIETICCSCTHAQISLKFFPLFIRWNMPVIWRKSMSIFYSLPIIQSAISGNIWWVIVIFAMCSSWKIYSWRRIGY